MSHQIINTLFLYWGKKGGGAKYSYEIARELTKREDINLHISVSNQCELINRFRELSLPGLYIDTYSSTLRFIYKWVFRSGTYQKMLRSYFLKHNIERVIIGMDFFWAPVIYRAAQASGVKTILVVHEPKPHPKEPVLLSLLKKYTLRRGILGAGHIVTLTQNVKEFIEEKFKIKPEDISVIPHGIFEYHKAELPKTFPEKAKKIKILYFGRIEYYKGLDILLDAFQLLQQDKVNVSLEVWGSGNIDVYRDQIKEIENINIQNRWLREEEITEVFELCHICVLPYRDASQSGIAGIASRAAMPIVACPAKGLTEQLTDCGAVIADDFTPEALRDALLTIIDNPELYSDLSEKSLAYSEKLSWKNIAASFASIAKKL